MQAFQALLTRVGDYPLVTDDSREVIAGAVFVYGGGRTRMGEFLRDAINLGASIIVSEVPIQGVGDDRVVLVEDRRQASMELARAFYGDPSTELKVIGVTGTCGKTSTSYLLESILEAAGTKVGVIGTDNIRYAGRVISSANTTPSTFVLQRTLREMVSAGCNAAVMEVSSHAISQGRTSGIAFDGALFTNLSHDHLDYHLDMESYFCEKSRLFTEYLAYSIDRGKSPVAALNADDSYGLRLFDTLRTDATRPSGMVADFALEKPGVAFSGAGLSVGSDGIRGLISCKACAVSEDIGIDSGLLGRFNAQNVLGAVALSHLLGIRGADICRGIENCGPIPGRLHHISAPDGPAIIVDFAHKPDAMEKVLVSLRELTHGRLICIFGCGGARDRSKRPVMGSIAASLSDAVVVTSDNSRGETFEQISNDIMQGIADPSNVTCVADRASAIALTIRSAQPEDTVLIAGRGTEQYLSVLGGDGEVGQIAFDDAVVAREALLARSALKA